MFHYYSLISIRSRAKFPSELSDTNAPTAFPT